MIRKPKFKVCARLGDRLLPQCQTPRFSTWLAKYTKTAKPGRGAPRQRSEYGMQFLEKQKVRVLYGVSEKQFASYVEKAKRAGGAHPSAKLFELLESRLDNVIFRMGLASSRAAARQLAAHGHFTVNGTRVTSPSYHLSAGDQISVRGGSAGNRYFGVRAASAEAPLMPVPDWISFDQTKLAGSIAAKPVWAPGAEPINLNAVIEFYGR